MPEIINHETMKRYDMFEREAGKLRASKKEKAMGEDGEEPLYAKSVVKTLLNELIKDDFRPFTDYDINVAIDKKEMRGDETRFRQIRMYRRGKTNFFTLKGVLDVLDCHRKRLKEYKEEDIPGAVEILSGIVRL